MRPRGRTCRRECRKQTRCRRDRCRRSSERNRAKLPKKPPRNSRPSSDVNSLDSRPWARQFVAFGKVTAMSKPTKSAAELIDMARAERKVNAQCSDGIEISVIRADGGGGFRTAADEATIAKPGYPECVGLIVQIG